MGLLADRRLNEDEVRFLEIWLLENDQVTSCWPGCVIAARVTEVSHDGVISAEELCDLKSVLEDLIGGGVERCGTVDGLSTQLPLDPDVEIAFFQRSFCFTGKFVCGPRAACAREVDQRGGTVSDNVTKHLDYLVIGTLASRDWANSTHGRKIEHAVAERGAGGNVRIISEEQWVHALDA